MTLVFSDSIMTQQPLPGVKSLDNTTKINGPVRLFCSSMMKSCPDSGVTWIPVTDVYKQAGSYAIRVDLPGVKKEDVEISIENNRVIIKGCRMGPETTLEMNYRHRQICYGNFRRCIRFSFVIDSEKMRSHFDNGVLEITVPTMNKLKVSMSQQLT